MPEALAMTGLMEGRRSRGLSVAERGEVEAEAEALEAPDGLLRRFVVRRERSMPCPAREGFV